MRSLRIDIWSDIACPWCYVGKRRLERALEQMKDRGPVEVVWHAFELDPSAPRVLDSNQTYAERLGKKYRSSPAEAQGMIDRMVGVAAQDGLDFRFDKIRPGNTFDAHRLLHLAGDRGLQDAVKERFLRAYMTEGEPIGDPDVLKRLATEAGLDEQAVAEVLGSDRYAREVRQDEEIARELGISGVPFFVIANRLGVSGAQPAEVLVRALERGWEEMGKEQPIEPIAEGAVCGPDGCD